MSAPQSSGWQRYGVVDRVVDDERDAVGVPRSRTRPRSRRRRPSGCRSSRRRTRGCSGGSPSPRVEVVGVVDEGDLPAELRERVVQEVVRAAVERRRRDDVAAVLGQVQQRDRLRGLPARGRECADAAVERGHPLLEHRLGRVHDPRVDDAELREAEQRRRVVGVAEDVARRLVDRNGPGAGGRVGQPLRRGPAGSRIPSLGHVDLLTTAPYCGRRTVSPRIPTGQVGFTIRPVGSGSPNQELASLGARGG